MVRWNSQLCLYKYDTGDTLFYPPVFGMIRMADVWMKMIIFKRIWTLWKFVFFNLFAVMDEFPLLLSSHSAYAPNMTHPHLRSKDFKCQIYCAWRSNLSWNCEYQSFPFLHCRQTFCIHSVDTTRFYFNTAIIYVFFTKVNFEHYYYFLRYCKCGKHTFFF